jgi:DNA-binding NarL/FixJ family response regulator
LEVLRLLAKGETTESIADQLSISRTTVNNHIQHILHKLNAHTRLEAIRRAEHAGLI